jgi:hypothetical protein
MAYEGEDIQMNVQKMGKGGNSKVPLNSPSSMTKTIVQKETANLLRSLILMTSSMPHLPEERFITIRLFYYDDVTPENYVPKYFKETPLSDQLAFNEPTTNVCILIIVIFS